jgi:hypothetical protein
MLAMLVLFLKLLAGHFVADYPLQSDFIANGKKRPGLYGVPWYYTLSGHAATHATAVYLVTGSMVLALCEFFLHFIIDTAKCEKWIGIHQDQWLHFVCKAGYVAFLMM